ncbi:MAG TPA: hypothetical protein VFO85_17685, partial [Vicinamibacteria bacterium]|nr:hypothetical protein [Vicinamibacteria bacterium]
MTDCALCGGDASTDELSEAAWVHHRVLERMAAAHPTWRSQRGACPSCMQDALLELLLESGGDALHAGIQR